MANIPISAFTVPANTVGIGLSGFSLTGSNAQSIVDLAGTWNTTGTPTALKLNVTDTASNAASLLMDLQVGGSSRLNVQKNGFVSINGAAAAFLNTLSITNVIAGTNTLTFTIGSNASRYALGTTTNHAVSFFTNNGVDSFRIGTTGSVQIRSTATFGYSSTDDASGTADVLLARDAAATLAQRNLANAQTFRIYNTTDSGITNYERGFVGWASNTLRIGTEKGGTGTARALELQTDGVTRLTIATGGGATFSGTLESVSVKTGAPAGGTSGTWKLGVAATVSPTSPNRTIEVDIGGTIYYIAAKTTND